MKTKTKKTNKFECVGAITVDAGIIQIGDPCYQERDWDGYLEKLDRINFNKVDAAVIPHENQLGNYGDYGAAVVITSGLCDGIYPIEVRRCNKTGAIKEVRIKFF